MEALNRLTKIARDNQLFKGLVMGEHGDLDEVIHLSFTDDALLFVSLSRNAY